MKNIKFRKTVKNEDLKSVAEIVKSTGFFYPYEIKTAVELVEENIEKGNKKSGYYFIFAQKDKKTIGYACYGPVACTASSFDLYWIAVHKNFSGQGIGKAILKEAEKEIQKNKGTGIYIETSSRKIYEPTRKFYLKCGYIKEAELKSFYGENDNKIIYVKKI